MASSVDICNLALSHLGETATVASIDPPEGSVQAEHCAQFYPIARDTLLEMASWGFATRRAVLAQTAQNWTEWRFAYAMPVGVLKAFAVLPESGIDDAATPEPYSIETGANGVKVIFANTPNAILRYTVRITDTTQFSPLFVLALSWHLASMLAGPVIKGDAGAAEGKRCAQMAMAVVAQAESSDASQRSVKPPHTVAWIAGR